VATAVAVTTAVALAVAIVVASHAPVDDSPLTGTASLVARDDSFVRESDPDSNFDGSVSTIAVDATGEPFGVPDDRGYLRFDVSGLIGTLSWVELRVYNWVPATTPIFVGAFSTVSDDWNGAASGLGDETDITYNLAPAPDAMLDVRQAHAVPAWLVFSSDALDEYVREQVAGDGTVTLRLEVQSQGSADICLFEDHENGGGTGKQPVLVLGGVIVPTPTPTPSPSPTSIDSPTPTATPSPTPTRTPSATPTPTRAPSTTPTASPSRTVSSTPSPTQTGTPSATSGSSPPATVAPTTSASPSATTSGTPGPSPTASLTPTFDPNATSTPTVDPSGTSTPTTDPHATPAPSSSATAQPSHTPGPSVSPAATSSATGRPSASTATAERTPTAGPGTVEPHGRGLYLPLLSKSQ